MTRYRSSLASRAGYPEDVSPTLARRLAQIEPGDDTAVEYDAGELTKVGPLSVLRPTRTG